MKGKGILIDDGYDLQIKPLRDANNKIISGLQVGKTLYQNQALILVMNPGELKLHPTVGAGIENILLGNDFSAMRRTIRQQMEQDGQKVKDVIFSVDKSLVIDATYS